MTQAGFIAKHSTAGMALSAARSRRPSPGKVQPLQPRSVKVPAFDPVGGIAPLTGCNRIELTQKRRIRHAAETIELLGTRARWEILAAQIDEMMPLR